MANNMIDFLRFSEAMKNIAPPVDSTELLKQMLVNEGSLANMQTQTAPAWGVLAQNDWLRPLDMENAIQLAKIQAEAPKLTAVNQIPLEQLRGKNTLENVRETAKASQDLARQNNEALRRMNLDVLRQQQAVPSPESLAMLLSFEEGTPGLMNAYPWWEKVTKANPNQNMPSREALIETLKAIKKDK